MIIEIIKVSWNPKKNKPESKVIYMEQKDFDNFIDSYKKKCKGVNT